MTPASARPPPPERFSKKKNKPETPVTGHRTEAPGDAPAAPAAASGGTRSFGQIMPAD